MRGDSGGKLGPGAQLGCFSRKIRVKERVGRCVPGQIRARDQLGRGSFPSQTRLSVCFKEGEAVLVKLKRGLERQALKPQSIIDLKERLWNKDINRRGMEEGSWGY